MITRPINDQDQELFDKIYDLYITLTNLQETRSTVHADALKEAEFLIRKFTKACPCTATEISTMLKENGFDISPTSIGLFCYYADEYRRGAIYHPTFAKMHEGDRELRRYRKVRIDASGREIGPSMIVEEEGSRTYYME